MSEKTFGAWLLEQREREDTTGTLARAWGQLREARGYNRHTKVKSIRELLSSSLGEDWERLHGDESIAAAETEWKQGELVGGHEQLALPDGPTQMTNYMIQGQNLPPVGQPMAVLWFDGKRYELSPGKSYVLALGPVLKEGTQAAEQGAAPEGAHAPADGSIGTNIAVLYGMADHNLPEYFDLASLPGDIE